MTSLRYILFAPLLRFHHQEEETFPFVVVSDRSTGRRILASLLLLPGRKLHVKFDGGRWIKAGSFRERIWKWLTHAKSRDSFWLDRGLLIWFLLLFVFINDFASLGKTIKSFLKMNFKKFIYTWLLSDCKSRSKKLVEEIRLIKCKNI